MGRHSLVNTKIMIVMDIISQWMENTDHLVKFWEEMVYLCHFRFLQGVYH